MNKLSYNRTLAWVVLVVAIIAAAAWGQHKRPAPLPEVKYGVWLCDDADMLSDATETLVTDYNKTWNSRYSAVFAVATVDSIKGWTPQSFADTLGNAWGLGGNDMLLLLYRSGGSAEYWVSNGENLRQLQMDSQQWALKSAMENAFYDNGADAGTVALFRQADVYYAQVLGSNSYGGSAAGLSGGAGGWPDRSGGGTVSVLLLILSVLVVWALLDRLRYNRYRRRTVVVGAPRVAYYPIFWGRRAAPRPVYPAPPPRPAVGHQPPRGSYQQPPRSGGYRNTPRPSRPTRPSGGGGSRSGRGGFGGGGFGGGRH